MDRYFIMFSYIISYVGCIFSYIISLIFNLIINNLLQQAITNLLLLFKFDDSVIALIPVTTSFSVLA